MNIDGLWWPVPPPRFKNRYLLKVAVDFSNVEYWNGTEWIPMGIYPRLLRYRVTRWIYNLQTRIMRKPRRFTFNPPNDWVKYEGEL